jgi:hypothetical protein
MVGHSEKEGSASMNQTVPFDQPDASIAGDLTVTRPAPDNPTVDNATYREAPSSQEGILITEALVPKLQLENSITQRKDRDVLSVIFMQILVLVVMILLTLQYSWLHNVPHILSPLLGGDNIDAFATAIANYDFVGVTVKGTQPSIFAVVLEVAIWSLAGVLARSEYYLSQIVVKKKLFHFWETASKLISDGAMGIAVAIAVVLFLRATQFVNLSLQNADVASIAAISFILGFYHEDTRHLLSNFRRKLSQSADESEQDKETS